MANTYTQVYIQIVFAVQGRENLIKESWREELEKYICGIITNNKSKTLAIYCNPDHVHVLIGLHPVISISTIAGDIKASSSKWINLQHKVLGRFNWQDGFGAFSYSKSQINNVINYIQNQPDHHKRDSFKDEYLEILRETGIEFNEKYLFDWM